MQDYFDFTHTVAADEIDDQGHVHNLGYLQWTLGAASAHTAAAGWDSGRALAEGFGWVVRQHSAKYTAAALAGDWIVVRTWVSDLSQFASLRKYVICRPADQTVLARVETRWVFVDLTRRKAIEIPAAARAGLRLCPSPPPLPWQS